MVCAPLSREGRGGVRIFLGTSTGFLRSPPFLKKRPTPIFALTIGQEKNNKYKHFRRDGLWDKQEPSPGQMGSLPGTKWDPFLGQTGLSLLNSTPFCPVCPWDGWGFVPGTIVPQGPSEKCLCVFCLLVSDSFSPQTSPS